MKFHLMSKIGSATKTKYMIERSLRGKRTLDEGDLKI